MSDTGILTAMLTGICLSAASGFRIFIPFFIISLTSNLYGIPELLSLHGIGSLTAMYLLLALSIIEVAGYYNPWIDNMLDLFATPLSLAAGIYLASIFFVNMNPVLKWILSILIGGGVSINIQLMTVKGRALASSFKSGSGNAVFSSIELFSAIIISVLAIYAPLLSFIVILFIVYLIIKYIIIKRRKIETT